MTVNYEIKGMLAKLLAEEDIIVEHKKVETACFNVHTRVLTLPMWKASNTVVDLLVAHEVGHSRETPNIDWTKNVKVPPQFVNVVEDARIEKLMKRRYPGLAKTFFNGYKELSDQDFFQLKDEKVEEMNLADRANLWFKVGNFIDVHIERGEETEIINLIADTETFADVLIASEALYKYCKQKQQEETKTQFDNLESQSSDANEQPSSDFSDQEDGENDQPGIDGSSSNESSQEQKKKESSNFPDLDEKDEPEVKTIESLEDALKKLVNDPGYENVYVELPQLNLDKIIVSNIEIHNKCEEYWNDYTKENSYIFQEIFGYPDKKFNEFKRSAQKEVNYLVKEFECRKAADSYARAATSRTGVLDCSKLHTYKYNEDLFRKVTTLANGKNHGLVFILDWSGSMQDVMLDTVKQLFNLVWFCKKVSIPFEVYAFTSDYPLVKYDENKKAMIREIAYKKRDGLIQVMECFSLMNLLSSKVNGKTLENQMKNIFRLACSFNYDPNIRYSAPLGMNLSGTPLNETLVSLHQILPKFQQENNLQKIQCVILTDGEACPIKYHREVKRHWENEPFIGTSHIGPNTFLRDRKTGCTYSFDCEYWRFTDILLRNLKDKFLNVNFIGIRVLESRDAGIFIRRYCGYYGSAYDQIMNSWKKERTFSIRNSGYHTYFGLSANALANDTEFDVHETATKSQIKNAFVKSLKSKKMNKKVLGEFVELIA